MTETQFQDLYTVTQSINGNVEIMLWALLVCVGIILWENVQRMLPLLVLLTLPAMSFAAGEWSEGEWVNTVWSGNVESVWYTSDQKALNQTLNFIPGSFTYDSYSDFPYQPIPVGFQETTEYIPYWSLPNHQFRLIFETKKPDFFDAIDKARYPSHSSSPDEFFSATDTHNKIFEGYTGNVDDYGNRYDSDWIGISRTHFEKAQADQENSWKHLQVANKKRFSYDPYYNPNVMFQHAVYYEDFDINHPLFVSTNNNEYSRRYYRVSQEVENEMDQQCLEYGLDPELHKKYHNVQTITDETMSYEITGSILHINENDPDYFPDDGHKARALEVPTKKNFNHDYNIGYNLKIRIGPRQ